MSATFRAWVAEVGPATRDPGVRLGGARTVSAEGETDGQSEASIGGYTSSRQLASTKPPHPFGANPSLPAVGRSR
jgi:hypothetical protein